MVWWLLDIVLVNEIIVVWWDIVRNEILWFGEMLCFVINGILCFGEMLYCVLVIDEILWFGDWWILYWLMRSLWFGEILCFGAKRGIVFWQFMRYRVLLIGEMLFNVVLYGILVFVLPYKIIAFCSIKRYGIMCCFMRSLYCAALEIWVLCCFIKSLCFVLLYKIFCLEILWSNSPWLFSRNCKWV